MRNVLMNCPDVVSIGIVWDSDEPEVRNIVNLVNALGTTLRLTDVNNFKTCSYDDKLVSQLSQDSALSREINLIENEIILQLIILRVLFSILIV